MSEKTENNKERITKMIDTAFIECYKEGFDDGYNKSYEQGQKDILEQLRYDDCISRQAVLKILKNNRYRYNISQEGNCEGEVLWSEKLIKDDACTEIEQLPCVIPTKKTGKWIYKDLKGQFCSACDKQSIWKFNYCPNCGVKMEVEK